MKSLNRYFENLFNVPELVHPDKLQDQWARDVLRIMVIISVPAVVIITGFLFSGYVKFDQIFPVYILAMFTVPIWFVSERGIKTWTRHYPAFICYLLGAYGTYAIGLNINIVLYFALAVLLAGLLQGIHTSLIYVVLGTITSIYFGVITIEAYKNAEYLSIILITIFITFFCLLGLAMIEWYLKSRLQHVISVEIINNQNLKKEINLRHEAETARMEQEAQLHLSEEKFSKAFIISPDSVNINRLTDGVYIDINQGFTKLMGYERDEILGKSSLDFNIWADPADRLRLVEGLMESGEVTNLEAKFIRKNGDVAVALMSARVLEVNNEKCILSITRDITDRKKREMDLRQAHKDLELAYDATLQGWVKALEMREKETANHSRRVVELTTQIAASLNIDSEEMIHIQRGAMLHDIGKMGVPDHILLKPGPLTPDEWEIMRMHPQFARSLLHEIDYLRPVIDIPYCHHEKWDGSGYPRGLKGDEIPLPARIFAIVDVYDALLSARPYRPAWTDNQALDYITSQSGTHFDPQIVDSFSSIIHSGI